MIWSYWFFFIYFCPDFFIVSKCSNIPEPTLEEWRSFVSTIQVSNIFNCFEESKWFICNLLFPICRIEPKRKIWVKVPICRDTCISYSTNPYCESIKPKFSLFSLLANYCSNFPLPHGFYCLNQPNVTESECLSNIYGRFLYLIFYGIF